MKICFVYVESGWKKESEKRRKKERKKEKKGESIKKREIEIPV